MVVAAYTFYDGRSATVGNELSGVVFGLETLEPEREPLLCADVARVCRGGDDESDNKRTHQKDTFLLSLP